MSRASITRWVLGLLALSATVAGIYLARRPGLAWKPTAMPTVSAQLLSGLGGVFSFAGGFFTALFAEPLRRRIYAPKVELVFGDSDYFFTTTPEIIYQVTSDCLYVRVKAQNTRAALARSCRAYLVNVERLGASGKFEATEYCESIQLSWSSQPPVHSFAALDLPRDVPHFVDIISTRPDEAKFRLHTAVIPLRYEKLLSTHGTYRFTVVVSGDGVKPVTIRPVVSWNGVWNQVAKG